MSMIRQDGAEDLPPAMSPSSSTQDGLALDLLRPLARKAVGMSGADVERLVREARGRARRARRELTWQDIEDLLSAGRLKFSDDLRWQLAIHECGHVLVHLALERRGTVEVITVEGQGGGFVRFGGSEEVLLSERQAMENLATLLAGRRAEIVFFGQALSGSGGAADSDLARATTLATSLETSLGLPPCRWRWHSPPWEPVSPTWRCRPSPNPSKRRPRKCSGSSSPISLRSPPRS